MAKTTGQLNRDEYPPGIRALIARTSRRTGWDDGATTWDAGATLWDCGQLGTRFARFFRPRQLRYFQTLLPQTTWDDNATTFDAGSTIWDVTLGTIEPADRYTANIEITKIYGLNFDNLTRYKQTRWHLCGLARGMTGRNLYIKTARSQDTPINKQPISPCSRRVTNPLASPFDWTP